MLEYIEDFWILKNSGIVIFHYQPKDEVDKNFFGAITIALNSYADILSKGGLSSFQFISKKFTFLKEKELIFVAKSSIKTKDSHVKQELHEISDKFFEKYSDNFINDWKGNIRIFTDFEKIIDTLH